jgi:thiamine-phosphate pyrophosphorylase
MMLHLVTDRMRLVPSHDDSAALHCLLEQTRYAVAAGLNIIQVRERDLDGRRLAALVAAMRGLTRGSRTRLVVNDRLDVALATGADGVHLRGDSFDATSVRQIVPAGFVIGRSVHSEHEARSAGPVDYLVAGTVWSTVSKADLPQSPEPHPLIGPEGVARIVAATSAPVIAIGGITPERAAAIAAAGAAGLAAIGAWIGETGACRAVPLHEPAQACRAAFAANMRAPFPPR